MAIDNEYEIIPPALAIKALVDGSYKNTAYALAELMDNSIEAGADNVELICIEEYRKINERRLPVIDQIIVADDGCGMNKNLLHRALQVGFGSRLETEQQTGMGRFGVGLPLASISQAEMVEVWSWTELEGSHKNANHQYLSVQEVLSGEVSHFNEPTRKPVPEKILKYINNLNSTGTIVLWNQLSNLKWTTGEGVLRNTEEIIGKMYRVYLEKSKTSIDIRLANVDARGVLTIDRNAVANDPLYLMKNTSTPEPWRDEPMFELHREDHIDFTRPDGRTFPVRVKSSYGKREARLGNAAGGQPWGIHARKNVGISVMRKGREIQTIKDHVNQNETERWWGLEVDFPPQLDEIFGIDNSKGNAKNFSDIFGENDDAIRDEQQNHEDGSGYMQLSEFCLNLLSVLKELREKVADAKSKRGGTKGPTRGVPSPEDGATGGTKTDPTPGDSDELEKAPIEERLKEIVRNLIKKGYSEEEAKEFSALIEDDGSKYYTTVKDMASPDFFNTETVAGCLEVTLNLGHKSMIFMDIVSNPDKIEDMHEDNLKLKLHQVVYGMRLILYAWARLRDQATPNEKERMDEIRVNWGIKAKQFFSNE